MGCSTYESAGGKGLPALILSGSVSVYPICTALIDNLLWCPTESRIHRTGTTYFPVMVELRVSRLAPWAVTTRTTSACVRISRLLRGRGRRQPRHRVVPLYPHQRGTPPGLTSLAPCIGTFHSGGLLQSHHLFFLYDGNTRTFVQVIR